MQATVSQSQTLYIQIHFFFFFFKIFFQKPQIMQFEIKQESANVGIIVYK